MGKVFLGSDASQAYTRSLYADGQHLKFDFSGNFLGYAPVDFGAKTLQEVDVVSALHTGTEVELAFNLNSTFSISSGKHTLSGVLKVVNSLPGLIFMGKRQEKGLEGSYTQYIYVFLQGHLANYIHLF